MISLKMKMSQISTVYIYYKYHVVRVKLRKSNKNG